MTEYAIVPRPLFIQYGSGIFQCSGIPYIADTAVFRSEAQVFASQIHRTFGDDAFTRGSRSITLLKTEGVPESYRLEILPCEIHLGAPDSSGIFRGLQTLRQLFLSGYNNSPLSITCGIIEDRPCFPWRGLMLDCARHFFSVEFIKKLLDALSLQHINIFHWHLTDDQGWRFPVKKYPLLADIGGRRYDSRNRYYVSGVYAEDEIRDIVSYAAERHIEVVPEVDFPGHSSSILASYPDLGCTGGPYHVEEKFGIFEDALCAGNDAIFSLAEAVFDTLSSLFPSKYVHIGGDEVLFNRWKACPKCQERLAELGLSEPAQLQGWITSRLAEMLHSRGKSIIGWDEILENAEQFPLPEDAVIMSWRGELWGNKAAALCRHVVMAPQTNGCYLDYRHIDHADEIGKPGVSSITQCHALNPITCEMDESEASFVLGGQGNLWTENIPHGKIAEYMIFPRICAIAEALWSGAKNRDIDDFAKRLAVHQSRLDKLDLLQYRGALE